MSLPISGAINARFCQKVISATNIESCQGIYVRFEKLGSIFCANFPPKFKSEITGNIFPKLLKYICQNFGKVDDMPLSNVMCLVTEMGMFLKAFTTKECKKALVP